MWQCACLAKTLSWAFQAGSLGYVDILFFSLLKVDQKMSWLLIQSQKAVAENHRARPVLCLKLLSLCFTGDFGIYSPSRLSPIDTENRNLPSHKLSLNLPCLHKRIEWCALLDSWCQPYVQEFKKSFDISSSLSDRVLCFRGSLWCSCVNSQESAAKPADRMVLSWRWGYLGNKWRVLSSVA